MYFRQALFILLGVFFFNVVSAQSGGYDFYMAEGQKAIAKEAFNEAIDYFKSAKISTDSSAQIALVDEWLDKANLAWRKSLEEARAKEETAKKRAQKEATISEASRLAALADFENDKGNHKDALYLSNIAINKGISVKSNIPLAQQAFGNAVYQIHKVDISTKKDKVLLTVFAPDGATVLTSGRGKSTRLWTAEGKLLGKLEGHEKAVFQAKYSADSKKILTCSADRTAKVWDNEGKLIYTFEGHKEDVLGGRFTKDGTKILTWSRDNTAKLWTTDSLLLATFEHQGNVYDAFFSEDEQKVLTRSSDFTVKVWEINGKALGTIKDEQKYITHTNFAPQGDLVLTCAANKVVKIWDNKGHLKASLPHNAMVESATFSSDGTKVLTVSQDSSAYVWTRAGQLLDTLAHKDLITEAHFSKSGNLVLTASRDHAAKIWDLVRDTTIEVNHAKAILGARFSENELKIVTFSEDKTARLWSMKGGLLMSLAHESPIAPQFSSDGRYILTSSNGKSVEMTPLPEIIFKQIAKKGLPELSKSKRRKFGIGD